MAIIQGELVKTKPKEEQAVSAGARQGQQSANILWLSPSQNAGTETSLKQTDTASKSGGMAGISESTLAGLLQYGQPYTPSAAVNQAQEYLQGVMSSGPSEFSSKYSGQIASLYNQIMNRPKFSYNVNRDPLFQQYKDQYTVSGQLAMQDAIGSAAALTGGYGNSWGTTAGFQAYQYYLQLLNNVIPELEQRAYSRYQDEGNELRKNLDMTVGLDNIDYSRYRDTVSDWQSSVANAASAYNTAAASDMSMWQNMQDYYTDLAALETKNYWQQQDEAYRQAQLAENQRQFDSNLAFKQYSTSLDEAYRQAQLAQNQSQWEAEQALEREKFDFQVRKYEDALLQALGESGTGSGGGSGFSTAPSVSTGSTGARTETLVAPAIVQRDNSGPLAATAPAISQTTWNSLQQSMADLNKNSTQAKNQTNAALKSTAELTGIPNGTLAVAALNAAKNGTVKNAVNDKLNAFSK